MSADEKPGFLSKIAKFVRHPTTNWSELDQEGGDRESRYSKQMLKDMIERRRRNDFVRKREFDMLRKIRQKGALPSGDVNGRPSFFQDSSQSKPDDRAQTLKKIDEIEAQMSQQWWRTKNPSNDSTSTDFGMSSNLPADGSSDFTQETRPPALKSASYLTTQSLDQVPELARKVPPVASKKPSSSFEAPTVPASIATPAPPDTRGTAYSLSRFQAVDVGEVGHDPELEEAAIRFANGDDGGAGACLIDALGPNGTRAAHQEVWLALFDLYRATGQQEAFESLAIDFANRFDRSAPTWISLPEQVSQMSLAAGQKRPGSSHITWQAPSVLRLQSVAMLNGALSKTPQPWCLDWRQLKQLDDSAAEPLLKLFSRWAEQAMQLRFVGVQALDDALKAMTESGNRQTPEIWWRLRMEALRVMHRPDEFELAALDYCVTYEVSPPSWANAACDFRSQDSDGHGGLQTIIGEPSAPDSQYSGLDSLTADLLQDDGHRVVELAGQVMGDATEALTTLDAKLQGARAVRIVCSRLVRVDFAAASALLNWVAARQAEGCRVEFAELHRLISSFFMVIGLHEHARLIQRAD